MLDETTVNPEKIERSIAKLNDILLNAAKKYFFVQKLKTERKHKKTQSQDWFNRECGARRKILRQKSKNLSSNPFDKVKQKQFIEARALYKKVCRKAEKAYRRNLTNKLMEIGKKRPKSVLVYY